MIIQRNMSYISRHSEMRSKRRISSPPSRRFLTASTILLATASSISQTNGFCPDRIKNTALITTSTYRTSSANARYSGCMIDGDEVPSCSHFALHMGKNGSGDGNSRKGRSFKNNDGHNSRKKGGRPVRNNRRTKPNDGIFAKTGNIAESPKPEKDQPTEREEELLQRITQLESLVSSQTVELRKLRDECNKLVEASEAFNEVVNLLRNAGLQTDETKISGVEPSASEASTEESVSEIQPGAKKGIKAYEAFDDTEIFGTAPSSVTDAADSAGTSVLAAILGGKQRMLVDVRDAELSRDLDVLVQFIELSILPVAAGLEGLKTQKNRVKIVFPTVSLLSQYRRTMALAAPEVIALSTLGFEPVERRDNLVFIIAPAPDDLEGLAQMNDLLESPALRQPVVVLNHHMVPLLGPGGDFDPVYHLRLLSVQYMTGESPPPEWERKANMTGNDVVSEDTDENTPPNDIQNTEAAIPNEDDDGADKKEDAELEAAMEHAHELGVHQGVTRAMVIRAYPRPWHIFVDTSPDSDADFEVAATFDECPTPEDVNYAIVECLEGSEREDELVAQQMQEALEAGQLKNVSDMLGLPHIQTDMDVGLNAEDEEDEDQGDEDDWHTWGTDTV